MDIRNSKLAPKFGFFIHLRLQFTQEQKSEFQVGYSQVKNAEFPLT